MKLTSLAIVLILGSHCIAQPQLEFVSNIVMTNSIPVGFSNNGDEYIVDGPTLKLFSNKGELQYSNLSLGNISAVDIFNPLKILVFYENFNTIVILDNRLAELQRLDFNAISPYRTISKICTAAESSFWYFNIENQRAELYDYRINKVRVQTLPITSELLAMDSDYNYCYLLTEKFITSYNYQGSVLNKIPNNGYKQLVVKDETIYVSDDKNIAFIADEKIIPLELKTKDLLIKRFYLTDETLYIYDGEKLQQFHIKSE